MTKKIGKTLYLDSSELSKKLDGVINEQAKILKKNLSKKSNIKSPICHV